MATSDNDYKLLWGRAAGICSKPGCQKDLTVILENSPSYNVGEMAHIIAKKPYGPRGIAEGGSDAYDNLILLCPTCHRLVDKAPEGTFPVEMLDKWKAQHERLIRRRGTETTFEDAEKLKRAVRLLLMENRIIWRDLGPQSNVALSNPGSNLHRVWDLKKLNTIVPNNNKIINYVEANQGLLSDAEYNSFLLFKQHANAFEENQYERLDDYPCFPGEFGEAFGV